MRNNKLLLKTAILREIFNIAPQRFQERNLERHPLTRKLGISGDELKKNIDFLVETGLIQRFPGKDYKETRVFEWLITEKGLAHIEEREREERQLKFNETVAFTGSIIALVTIYNFIIQNFSFENYQTNLVIIKVVFLILLLTCIVPLVIIIFNFWKGAFRKW